MKRMREMEKCSSEIRSAIEELSMVVVKDRTAGGDEHVITSHIPTKPFLSVCNSVIQVLDKIGPTMAVLRNDMNQNIKRLEKLIETDTLLYSNVVEILKKETREGNAKKGPSCSKAFVWLTRSLDFTVALLQVLVDDFGQNMEQAVEGSYNITLKAWHGWISSAAFKVALKLVPETRHLISILMAKDQDDDMIRKEIHTFIALLSPLLKDIHSILRTYNLDKLKSI